MAERPVLVDFESDTILDRQRLVSEQAATLVGRARTGRLGAIVREILFPTSTVTKRNVARLFDLLRERGWKRVLVVGGGTIGSGMAPLYRSREVELIAFDVYASENAQFVADGHSIPLRDGSVDAVVVQAVLEHVVDPPRVVAEIHRVLRDGGIVYGETPFMQQVHEGPYDFTRFTHSGHRYLFREFEELGSGAILGAGTQLLWSLDHFARSLFRSTNVGKLARAAFFWLSYLDRAGSEPHAIDTASAVYFLGTKSGKAMQPRELVPYYRGAQR